MQNKSSTNFLIVFVPLFLLIAIIGYFAFFTGKPAAEVKTQPALPAKVNKPMPVTEPLEIEQPELEPLPKDPDTIYLFEVHTAKQPEIQPVIMPECTLSAPTGTKNESRSKGYGTAIIRTRYTENGTKIAAITCSPEQGITTFIKYNPDTGAEEEALFYMPNGNGYTRIVPMQDGGSMMISYRKDGTPEQIGYYEDNMRPRYIVNCTPQECTPWKDFDPLQIPAELKGKTSLNNPYSMVGKDLSYCALSPDDIAFCGN